MTCIIKLLCIKLQHNLTQEGKNACLQQAPSSFNVLLYLYYNRHNRDIQTNCNTIIRFIIHTSLNLH